MLFLASNSPRRKQLLALGGWEFTLAPVEIDEQPHPGEDPGEYVLRLAVSKARAAAMNAPAAAIIIAADTTVVGPMSTDATEGHGAIMGKPANASEAAVMLRQLRAQTHQVLTALAALRAKDAALLTDLCVTNVKMRDYSDAEMAAYIASGDPLDKAGAYAIQHPGFKPVENLRGCYTNVVGLPLCRLARLLRTWGILPRSSPPFACLHQEQDKCSIFDLNL